MTNIWIAASDNNIAAVRSYISSGEHTANDGDENGYTPLHAAASYSHTDLLQYLISAGGNVNATDQDGDTPLFVVETVSVARMLVEEFGADYRHRNSDGLTAREKFEAEMEDDGETVEEIVAYLRSLEGENADIVTELREEIALQGSDARVEHTDIDEAVNPDDAELAERRKQIENIIKAGGSETEIRNLVENAVRLQLSEMSAESSRKRVARD